MEELHEKQDKSVIMSTLQIFDLKEKKAVSVKDTDVNNYLLLEGDRYVPVQGQKYMVIDEKTGDGQEVLGENLRQAMGDGKTLTSLERYSVRKQLEAQRSQAGEFFKQTANEALTLGLADLLKQKPSNPFEQMIVDEEQKIFGKAKTAGTIAGNILPFLLGGVGGMARLGAKAQVKLLTSVLKGVGKLPSAQVLKATLKGSEKAGKASSNLIKKMGGGKAAQTMADVAGRVAGLATIQGGVDGLKKGITEADKRLAETKNMQGGKRAMDVMNSAVGEGYETFKEVATSTAVLMGGLGVAGKFVKGTGWLTKKTAEGIRQTPKIAADKARQSFFKAGNEKVSAAAVKEKERIAQAFKMDKKSKAGDVYKKAGEHLEQQFGQNPVNRVQAITMIEAKQKTVGESIGHIREELGAMPILAKGFNIKTPFNAIKKLVGDIEGSTTYRKFFNDLKNIESKFTKIITQQKEITSKVKTPFTITQEKPNFYFGDIKPILDIFKHKSTSKIPSSLKEAYSKAYKMLLNFESQTVRKTYEASRKLGLKNLQFPVHKQFKDLIRDDFKGLPVVGGRNEIRKVFENIRKLSKDKSFNSELSNIEKSFYKQITQQREVISKIKTPYTVSSEKPTIYFKQIKEILNVFEEGAKFQKGTAPTALNKLYRRAYNILSHWESSVASNMIKNAKKLKFDKALPEIKTLPNLLKAKDLYHKNQSILNLMDKPTRSGFWLSNFYPLKDLMYVVGAGVGGGALGGIPTGIGAAAGLAAGMAYVKSTGARLLHTAKFMDKAHSIFKKVRVPRKIANFMDKSKKTFSEVTDRKPISFSTISTIMLGKETGNLDIFDEEFQSKDEVDQISTGQEDLFSSIEDYGGQSNAMAFNEQMIKTKQLIMQTKPKPYIDRASGKARYSPLEVKRWIKDLDASLTPDGFMDHFRKGSITRKQLGMFESLYPRFSTDLHISLIQGLRNGEIKKSAEVRRFLSLKEDNTLNDRVFYNLDKMTQIDNRRRQSKLNPRSKPSISTLSQAGVVG